MIPKTQAPFLNVDPFAVLTAAVAEPRILMPWENKPVNVLTALSLAQVQLDGQEEELELQLRQASLEKTKLMAQLLLNEKLEMLSLENITLKHHVRQLKLVSETKRDAYIDNLAQQTISTYNAEFDAFQEKLDASYAF